MSLVDDWGKVITNVNDAIYKVKKYVRKTVAFTGAAGAGAVGTVNLFTVTGKARIKLTAICTEDLTGATATVEVGITGATAGIIAQTTATDIDSGEVWKDASPDAAPAADDVGSFILTNGQDVILTVATANVTDGTLEFDLEYEALSSDCVIAAA